jgi:hypothetical protein
MGRLGGARMSVCCIRTEAGELKKRQSGCVCVCGKRTDMAVRVEGRCAENNV